VCEYLHIVFDFRWAHDKGIASGGIGVGGIELLVQVEVALVVGDENIGAGRRRDVPEAGCCRRDGVEILLGACWADDVAGPECRQGVVLPYL